MGTDEMNVSINAAGGHNGVFACDNFGIRPDDDRYSWLNVGVSCFTDPGDRSVLNSNFRLDNSALIDNDRVRNHRVPMPLTRHRFSQVRPKRHRFSEVRPR
jgi:hypothetical protein